MAPERKPIISEKEREDMHYRVKSNLKYLRSLTELSQVEVARQVEISVSYIHLLECGARLPNFDTLISLAKVYGLPPGELIDRDLRAEASELVTKSKKV
jgi:transcriptional regulator with XRE-family HTH domain